MLNGSKVKFPHGSRWLVTFDWRWCGANNPHHWETEHLTYMGDDPDGFLVFEDGEGTYRSFCFDNRQVTESAGAMQTARRVVHEKTRRPLTITETWHRVDEVPFRAVNGSRWLLREVSYRPQDGRMVAISHVTLPVVYEAVSPGHGVLRGPFGRDYVINPEKFTEKCPGRYHYMAVGPDRVVVLTLKGLDYVV